MIPLLQHLFHSFFFDELAFTRWLRGGCLAVAASGLAFADQLGALLAAPRIVLYVKVSAVVCGFVAGAITAGQRNP
jgi:hypothetical protein